MIKKHVLCRGEVLVLPLPLLPAFGTQLGEVIGQALQFLGSGLFYIFYLQLCCKYKQFLQGEALICKVSIPVIP